MSRPPGAGLGRAELEVLEESRLAPCAMRSVRATRRRPLEAEGRAFDLRTEFQRDRDRIVHSRAFRRLRHKTRVGQPDRGDHYRNLLTHTLEVAGIARTIARSLSLNEDLVEAITLGHAVGHAAFGLAGEGALDDILSGKLPIPGLDPRVAARCGGFTPHLQSLRVLDLIEKRYAEEGLNLTDAVREGIYKQKPVAEGSGDADLVEEGLGRGWPAHLEARVVQLADRITRPVHDLDDGIEEGAIRLREAEALGIVRELVSRLGEGLVGTRRVERLHQLNRGMVHLLVTSAVTTSAGRLAAWMAEERIAGHDDFLKRRESLPERLIGLSPAVEGMLDEMEKFVERRVLNDARARRWMEQGRRLTADLFAAFYGNPLLLDDHVLLRFKERAGVRYLRDLPPDRMDEEIASRYRDSIVFVRLIADHLAAMSDTYALGEARRLGLPRG